MREGRKGEREGGGEEGRGGGREGEARLIGTWYLFASSTTSFLSSPSLPSCTPPYLPPSLLPPHQRKGISEDEVGERGECGAKRARGLVGVMTLVEVSEGGREGGRKGGRKRSRHWARWKIAPFQTRKRMKERKGH